MASSDVLRLIAPLRRRLARDSQIFRAPGTHFNRTLQFGAAYLRNPLEVAAICPSSSFLAERMLHRVDWKTTRVVLELGPGLGSFTERILAKMDPAGKLIALDTNPQFVTALKRSCADPRLTVVKSSALRLEGVLRSAGIGSADCIICGLPFGNMSWPMRLQILQNCRNVLRRDGRFVLFQYRWFLLPMLKRLFPSVAVEYEFLNLPPAFVFHCSK